MTKEENRIMDKLGQKLVNTLIEIHNHAFNTSNPTEQFKILDKYYNGNTFIVRTYRGPDFLKLCPNAVTYKKKDSISTTEPYPINPANNATQIKCPNCNLDAELSITTYYPRTGGVHDVEYIHCSHCKHMEKR